MPYCAMAYELPSRWLGEQQRTNSETTRRLFSLVGFCACPNSLGEMYTKKIEEVISDNRHKKTR